MTYQASRNKIAWEHQAYRFWVQSTGTPDQVAADMLDDPGRWLRRHLHLLGDVKDRRVLNPLGSTGERASLWRSSGRRSRLSTSRRKTSGTPWMWQMWLWRAAFMSNIPLYKPGTCATWPAADDAESRRSRPSTRHWRLYPATRESLWDEKD